MEAPVVPGHEGEMKAHSDQEKGKASEHDADLKEINETGHVQELDRNFSLLSICSVGITVGNTWAALGGSIVVALYNGGPPGVIYEFIAVSIFYWFVSQQLN
jgi:choline transport protein